MFSQIAKTKTNKVSIVSINLSTISNLLNNNFIYNSTYQCYGFKVLL